MLKLLNLSKVRISILPRHISTSCVRWQRGELTKVRDRDDAIRAIEKKPKRLPLVKNFFVGEVDTELLAFPEAIYENEHNENAKKRRATYDDFLKTNIFNNPDDSNNITKLKEFGCFHNNASLVTELMFSFSEPESSYLSYSSFLGSHQQVLRLVNEFGDASQKLKYVPKLESGDFIAVPCLFESRSPDSITGLFNTFSSFNDSTDEWTLNGDKHFVLISPEHKDSTLFLVISAIETTNHIGDFKESVTALLVDGSLPGVTISGTDETIGLQEKTLRQVTVSFNDVKLDKSNVLNGDSNEIVSSLLSYSRFEKGVQALGGVMKPILAHLADHCINTKSQGVPLKDIETIREQLGYLTSQYYALESMVYMTAGLIDIYEEQDVELESAIIHAFAIQAMTEFMIRPLHAVGPQAVIKGGKFERYIRDAAQLAATAEQMDGLKQYISVNGLNHAGKIVHENIRKDRNPLHHPAFVFSRMFKQISIEHPKKKFNLEEYLHPSLTPAAHFLEFSILRLNASVEIVLARHGLEIVERSIELGKLTDAAILCYAMFASLARASRSYCIGLRNADQEIHLSSIFCYESSEKVKKIAKDIDNGSYATSDYAYKTAGEKLIEAKGYHLVHPTTRNF